ncbi:hypothetical protein SMSP2_00419 [Limihaloglobus sulfuriphilus]|uniref:HicB family protein n=1 Tax=Limihaloglobus sulfuriphilus TaxID=1851148 RepID=A0A1Q2MBP5_9BACT|nr:type II toxin-antitoxin system HicB family antitoxin [Limihaloglobus sulfuriphilus]AQQ70080.1 hypothetical protein SMSP2_00419 [Limihaloglobus sulfuriphilus]
MKADKYTYKVTWVQEDGEYAGLCVEFPSLSWLAKTPEAALRGVRKVVSGAVADMRANGEDIPEPLATHKFSGKFQVRIPPDVHRNLVIEAAEEHISLNRLVSAKLTKQG